MFCLSSFHLPPFSLILERKGWRKKRESNGKDVKEERRENLDRERKGRREKLENERDTFGINESEGEWGRYWKVREGEAKR